MEVIVKECETHPSCPHGPCLMFERHSAKGTKTGRRFFACSACRDRSVCSFFQWVDDEPSDQVKKHWKMVISKSKPPFTHEECMKRLATLQKLQPSERKYCKTCSLLLLPSEDNHKKHDIISSISSEKLLQPSLLFQSLSNKKAEAQYFFSENTIQFVTSLLDKKHYTKLVLIGAPKIQEHLNCLTDSKMTSFLMDIDHRYMQFFSPVEFCHYNLFNNHFFEEKKASEKFKQYLLEKEDEKVVIVLDPPFGGLVEAICYSLQQINNWWQSVNNKPSSKNIPILWFFPYFLEPRIIKNMPDMVMMDYKVEYLNHKKFGSSAGSKGSPIRIFTNIKSSFVLPKSEGYRFCSTCKRYVSKENKHCSKCNACTTKHGKTYKHCDDCQHCVKSSYVHCEVHNKCVPELSNVNQSAENKCKCGMSGTAEDSLKCYKCFGIGHKKRDCSFNRRSKSAAKKRKKM